jgi:hypothetical protein
MNDLSTRTFLVKFLDKHHQQEEWRFQGYSFGHAFDAYTEYKPEGAQLISISEEGEW